MGLVVKNPPVDRRKRHRFNQWVRKMPWRRKQQPTLVLLPGESHGQRSLASYSPWGCTESVMTKVTYHEFHEDLMAWGGLGFLQPPLCDSHLSAYIFIRASRRRKGP